MSNFLPLLAAYAVFMVLLLGALALYDWWEWRQHHAMYEKLAGLSPSNIFDHLSEGQRKRFNIPEKNAVMAAAAPAAAATHVRIPPRALPPLPFPLRSYSEDPQMKTKLEEILLGLNSVVEGFSENKQPPTSLP